MLVAGDIEVLADEAYVAALGSLGAVGMAENPLVGLPVAVAVAGRGHMGADRWCRRAAPPSPGSPHRRPCTACSEAWC